ncbi:MAG: ATP-dependent RecD-like DNA helicase [Proteobacteria bacterium]|jgi:exodeoxyribonuclease V alpha subunit|nr:ATP-dependent RecD-like DNA helicase [Pseudomonadota bacterium]
MPAQRDDGMIEGVVDRVVFRNEGNGWTVLRLSVDGRPLVDTVVGHIQQVAAGERIRCVGEWTVDPKHGRQFRAETCLPLAPSTERGIEKFLGSGVVPGVGPVMARRLVTRFGLETLEVIERAPKRLAEVEGIGPKRAAAISLAMAEKRNVRDVMVFLESAGASPAYAHRIHQRYGPQAIRIVSDNPYRLAGEVAGIGFLTADRIASVLGVPLDSPYRAEAGVVFALEELAGEGHVFARSEPLLARAGEILRLEPAALEAALERLRLRGGVRVEEPDGEPLVYLPRLYRAETEAAAQMCRLLGGRTDDLAIDPEAAARRAEALSGIELADGQRAAFGALSSARVIVITGGPGTGKTTLLRGIVACLAELGQRIALAAPTGRAARRMADSTGRDARTIHRLLEFAPRTMRFERCAERPLEEDVIVVDELSMVDIELFAALLGAVRDGARLVLVGDPDQLPSVGPGTVLADLLAVGAAERRGLAVIRLTEIFRQARSSLIVIGAHDVLAGTMPRVGGKGEDADLFLVERESPEGCLEVIADLVATRIPDRFGLDPIAETQVLTPMNRGVLGAHNLNAMLKDLLNPGDPGADRDGPEVGDKVMQIRNNYDLEVFNGDVGRVTAAGAEGEWLEVAFPERVVRYPMTELDQITLAYACTVHKAQGSEYPAVVIPIHTQHYVMLQRNLLYTAMTRGRRLVVIVGSRRALGIAVRNDRRQARGSGLGARVLRGLRA